ncbi:hypothetical protein, partial [Paracoccus yeei]
MLRDGRRHCAVKAGPGPGQRRQDIGAKRPGVLEARGDAAVVGRDRRLGQIAQMTGLQLPTNVFCPEKGLAPEESSVIRCLAPSVKQVRIWGRVGWT